MIVAGHEVPGKASFERTVQDGTALAGGVVPGTSCQATISLSLRDKSHSPIQDWH
jgi:hypothetical protein